MRALVAFSPAFRQFFQRFRLFRGKNCSWVPLRPCRRHDFRGAAENVWAYSTNTFTLAARPALIGGGVVSDRVALYRRGREAVTGALALIAAEGLLTEAEAAARRAAIEAFEPPAFPLSGRDVVEAGIGRGPAVGVILRHLEDWWLREDFRPDAEALRRRLQTMIAAQQ